MKLNVEVVFDNMASNCYFDSSSLPQGKLFNMKCHALYVKYTKKYKDTVCPFQINMGNESAAVL